jgi:hypothetical protein
MQYLNEIWPINKKVWPPLIYNGLFWRQSHQKLVKNLINLQLGVDAFLNLEFNIDMVY